MRRAATFAGIDAAERGMVDLAPMLDVVFILLIFFIVSASFVAQSGISVERPQAASAEVARGVRILVAIAADDTVWIDGEPTDMHGLYRRIALAQAQKPGGSLLVQADARSRAATLARVLDAAHVAGIGDAALSVRRE